MRRQTGWQQLGWLLLIITGSLVYLTTNAFAQASAESTTLQDIVLFGETGYGQWAGSGNGMTLLTESQYGGPTLPIDRQVTRAGLPAYHIEVTGNEGWWSVLLAGNDWEAFSLAGHYPEGSLTFFVKTDGNDANFKIGVQDISFEREPRHLVPVELEAAAYGTLSAEWQQFTIPLTDLIPNAYQFNLEQVFALQIASANGNPVKFWLNDIRFVTEQSEADSPAIKLNQLGYLPNARKLARVSGFPDMLSADVGTRFEVRDIDTNQVAYAGTLELLSELDVPVSGERVLTADFSPLTREGRYYLAVSAYRMTDSPLFEISPNVYESLLVDTMRYFYHQRSGVALTAPTAGEFARRAGHPQDAQAEFRSGRGTRDVSGGWYDAGDYGKYVNAGASAVSDLLWAVELYPDQFSDSQFNILESGNGSADILDEIRWELDWMLKMQDDASGGFWHMVQPTEDTTADNTIETRYIEDVAGSRQNVRPTSSTADAVAALAHASIVFESADAEYAARLLTAAEQGWSWLSANPDGVAPVDGPYSDPKDDDNRFWAAAALYRATGSAVYHDYLKATYRDVETYFDADDENAYGVSVNGMLGWLNYVHSVDQDGEMIAFFTEQFGQWQSVIGRRYDASAWNLTLESDDFYWGSNHVALATPLVLAVVAHSPVGEQVTLPVAQIMQDSVDYLLGTNPLRFSYISGYGESSLQYPHAQQWSSDGVDGIPPGVLAGGPNAYSNPHLASQFNARRYVDSAGAWTLNEHTIYWNSALVFHVAGLLASDTEPQASSDGLRLENSLTDSVVTTTKAENSGSTTATGQADMRSVQVADEVATDEQAATTRLVWQPFIIVMLLLLGGIILYGGVRR